MGRSSIKISDVVEVNGKDLAYSAEYGVENKDASHIDESLKLITKGYLLFKYSGAEGEELIAEVKEYLAKGPKQEFEVHSIKSFEVTALENTANI